MTETVQATARRLTLLDEQSAGGACERDGCGCGAADTSAAPTPAATDPTDEEIPMTTHSYAVSGMTCGHCAGAVSSELKALDAVTDVRVELVAGGTSTVTVTSTEPLDEARVAAALHEAGDYRLG